MIVELRSYKICMGHMPAFLETYERHGLELQRKIQGNLIGFFQREIGTLSSTVQIWGYDSFADRERRRSELMAHPDWSCYLDKADKHIVEMENSILRPVSFSPIR